MMTAEDKAEFFKKALAETGDVVEAFRRVDKASRQPHPARKMPPARVAALRAERARGRRLLDLAHEFSISETHACLLCRGVTVAAPAPGSVPPIAGEIVRVVGTDLFRMPCGWERRRRTSRTRAELGVAQQVAVLAMAGQGMGRPQIAEVLGRTVATVGINLELARANPQVRQMVNLVREILARDAAPIAVPEPLSAPASAAA